MPDEVYHKDLEGLDLHKPFPYGFDADKPENPKVGAWYFAVDSKILYRCLVLGEWSNYLNKLGKGPDCIDISETGSLVMKGGARYVDLKALSSMDVFPTHHAALEVTALADPGYVSSSLDNPPNANRFLSICTVDGGLNVKGRQSGSYSQGDTTAVGAITMICINTKNASWVQETCWYLVIDIAIGNVTGHFTIFCPPFNLESFDRIKLYITNDGATYYSKERYGFNDFICGSEAAEEVTTNNLTAGSNVVCNVVDTAGFHVGGKVFVSDSLNSEWTRIKSIIVNTSITVSFLSNNYTIVNGSKLDVVPTTRTAYLSVVHRNVGKLFKLLPDINSGATLQFGVPHHIDKTEPLKIAFQYIARSPNPGSQVVKIRTQNINQKIYEVCPESDQYGILRNTTFIPSATVDINNVAPLPEIPVSDWVDVTPKRVHLMQVVRMGADAGDTFAGAIDVVAIVYLMKSEKLGGAEALFG